MKIPVVVLTAKDLNAEDHRRLNGYVEAIIAKGEYKGMDLLEAITNQITRYIDPPPLIKKLQKDVDPLFR